MSTSLATRFQTGAYRPIHISRVTFHKVRMTTRELEQLSYNNQSRCCIDSRADASADTFGQANASLSICSCTPPQRTVPAWSPI